MTQHHRDEDNVLERLEKANLWMREPDHNISFMGWTLEYLTTWLNRRDPSVYAAAGDFIKAQNATIETLLLTIKMQQTTIRAQQTTILNRVPVDADLIHAMKDAGDQS